MFRRKKPKMVVADDDELKALREKHKLEQDRARRCLDDLPPDARKRKAQDIMEELLAGTLNGAGFFCDFTNDLQTTHINNGD